LLGNHNFVLLQKRYTFSVVSLLGNRLMHKASFMLSDHVTPNALSIGREEAINMKYTHTKCKVVPVLN
jgi:hypothetical protein